MASIPCFSRLNFAKPTSSSSSSGSTFCVTRSPFLGIKKMNGFSALNQKINVGSGYRTKCLFQLGKTSYDAEGAGIYGSQGRDDYNRDDVEQYFNYMGMLAAEGSYDRMEELLSQNIHSVDLLLMMAASEGDKPKIEELLRAGASYDVKDMDGKTALELADDEDIKDFILNFRVKRS